MSTHATMMAVSPEAKPFYQSKSFWAGAGEMVLGAIQLFQNATILSPGTATLAIGIITILLRWVTTQPMEFVMDPKKVTPPTMTQMPDPKHGG